MDRNLRSQIDQACPPSRKDYFMTIHQRAIRLESETHITEAPNQHPLPHPHHDPYIENFYCCTLNTQLVKVTKIRIGNQLVTMIDRISFPPQITNEENHEENSRSFPLEVASSGEKLKLSAAARNVLGMLEGWMRENEPDLYITLEGMKEGTKNENELVVKMGNNYNFRQGFSQFCQYIVLRQSKKSILRTIEQWKKSIVSPNHIYNKKENFIDDVLSGKEVVK